jgi:hypothetical protein
MECLRTPYVVPWHPWRGRQRVRADASVLPPGNFITDATVRPSHGRPCDHRPTIRPSVIVRETTLLPAHVLAFSLPKFP